jgi:RimJ/RimL family protein N-acetyltransferase
MASLGPCCGQHPPLDQPLGDVTTERLDLRRFRDEDLDELAAVFATVEVWRYPFGRGLTRDETAGFLDRQIASWDRCGFGLWAVVERSSGRLTGFVGLSIPAFLPEILPAIEVGWRLHPDVWGQGYASEAARAALDESFSTLGLDVVCSVPQSDNAASVRVCERLGLRLARRVDIPATEARGALRGDLFEVTAEEWLSRRQS